MYGNGCYGVESAFFLVFIFLNRRICFSSFSFVPGEAEENKEIKCSFKLVMGKNSIWKHNLSELWEMENDQLFSKPLNTN